MSGYDLAAMIGPERLAKGMWWGRAWSLVEGCTKVSAGCAHCWSERQAARMVNNPAVRPRHVWTVDDGHWTGTVNLMAQDLRKPMKVRKPTVWSIWNDLFHNGVPDSFIKCVWRVMERCPQHVFIILTKRPGRKLPDGCEPLPNVILGTSVEDQETANERIPQLLGTNPKHQYMVSYEPALGPVDFRPFLQLWGDNDTREHFEKYGWGYDEYSGGFMQRENPHDFTYDPQPGIAWVVPGGETGMDARPAHPDWFRTARDQCAAAGVAFLFKQWGEWCGAESLWESSTLQNGKFARHQHQAGTNSLGHWFEDGYYSERVGKHRAGRELDGRVHDGLPVI